jgi:hypothetical protein
MSLPSFSVFVLSSTLMPSLNVAKKLSKSASSPPILQGLKEMQPIFALVARDRVMKFRVVVFRHPKAHKSPAPSKHGRFFVLWFLRFFWQMVRDQTCH